jgi:hypothetical protein
MTYYCTELNRQHSAEETKREFVRKAIALQLDHILIDSGLLVNEITVDDISFHEVADCSPFEERHNGHCKATIKCYNCAADVITLVRDVSFDLYHAEYSACVITNFVLYHCK